MIANLSDKEKKEGNNIYDFNHIIIEEDNNDKLLVKEDIKETLTVFTQKINQ